MASSVLGALVEFFLPSAVEMRIVEALTAEVVHGKVAPKAIPCGGATTLALLPYHDPAVKALLWALKYRASSRAAALLSGVLAETLEEEWLDAELTGYPTRIVVVPRSPESMKQYGANHLERIVEALPERFRKPYVKDALSRDSSSARQTTLKRNERLANMQGALSVEVRERVLNTHVIILDDIVTTGATLAEASRALREAGAIGVSLIALAYS